MRSTKVKSVKMGDAAVACGNGDILHLDIHVIFSFKELAAKSLTGFDLDCDDMALRCCQLVNWFSKAVTMNSQWPRLGA